jgi:hypothetical protein
MEEEKRKSLPGRPSLAVAMPGGEKIGRRSEGKRDRLEEISLGPEWMVPKARKSNYHVFTSPCCG